MKIKEKYKEKDLKNVLIEGDCLSVLKNFPSASIDMVLCDLPYGTTQNKWDSVIDLDRLWSEYNRVVKPSGAIVLTSQAYLPQKLFYQMKNISNTKLYGRNQNQQIS